MNFHLENAVNDFRKFWNIIGAEGDINAAIDALEEQHNATGSDKDINSLFNKTARIIKKIPAFIRNA